MPQALVPYGSLGRPQAPYREIVEKWKFVRETFGELQQFVHDYLTLIENLDVAAELDIPQDLRRLPSLIVLERSWKAERLKVDLASG